MRYPCIEENQPISRLLSRPLGTAEKVLLQINFLQNIVICDRMDSASSLEHWVVSMRLRNCNQEKPKQRVFEESLGQKEF